MGGWVHRCVVVAALVAAAVLGRAAAADEAVAPLATPVVVDPAACRVEPRSVREIVALAGAAEPGQEVPAAPLASPLPAPAGGEPADPETAAAVAATLVELAACTDRGELARAYALVTDDYLRDTVGPLTEEHIALLEGVGFPKAGERGRSVLTVAEVRILGDGRAFAIARVEAEGEEPLDRGYLLDREGERWLLAAAVEVAGLGTPAP